jgi:hypothetical protein
LHNRKSGKPGATALDRKWLPGKSSRNGTENLRDGCAGGFEEFKNKLI